MRPMQATAVAYSAAQGAAALPARVAPPAPLASLAVRSNGRLAKARLQPMQGALPMPVTSGLTSMTLATMGTLKTSLRVRNVAP